jgi:hypothetical protein
VYVNGPFSGARISICGQVILFRELTVSGACLIAIFHRAAQLPTAAALFVFWKALNSGDLVGIDFFEEVLE